jgi:hypothetical protein
LRYAIRVGDGFGIGRRRMTEQKDHRGGPAQYLGERLDLGCGGRCRLLRVICARRPVGFGPWSIRWQDQRGHHALSRGLDGVGCVQRDVRRAPTCAQPSRLCPGDPFDIVGALMP